MAVSQIFTGRYLLFIKPLEYNQNKKTHHRTENTINKIIANYGSKNQIFFNINSQWYILQLL